MKKRSNMKKLMEPMGLNGEENLTGSSDRIRHRIAEVAYERYEQRGREDGHDAEDWLKAEAILNGTSE